MSESSVRLSDLIAPVFYPVHKSIKNNRHVHYFLKGGRGSTKSSFISIEIINGMMKYEKANAVVFRKYGTDLKDSVYNQLIWAIEVLGVTNFWIANQSPLRLTYKPTGQQIIFRGVDDPKKAKSIKPKHGFFKYVWYEEADQYSGMAELRSINQSLLRGGFEQVVFYSYNPPKSVQNWINDEVRHEAEGRYIHHSTYLDVPSEWLGKQFISEAEDLKRRNEDAYKHEYLGEVTGTGGEVFKNITSRKISDNEILSFDKVNRGLDFGYSIDPCAYICCHLHNGRLYIYHEFYKVEAGFKTLAEAIKSENISNDTIEADSAEPRSISELRTYGIRIIPVKKRRDSVNYGITFLQELEEIIIDPVRCPNTLREFCSYELERDRDNNLKADFPDKNNHSIDAVRYALARHIRDYAVKKTTKFKENKFPDFFEDEKDIFRGDNVNKFIRR